ncbi:MAG: GGDEF domain-containing protein [Planctomycetes bacterium]|nr:GGDEF domain-containing protein [Planctomycetota bacterium]
MSEESATGATPRPAARMNVRVLLRAALRPYTYRPIANPYVRFGLLFGLPIPLVTLGLELWLRGLPATAAAVGSVLREHPIQLLFLAHPLLFAWVFGLIGTLARERNVRLTQLFERLNRLASHDSLTGLLNHGHILEHLALEIERARRAHLPLCCLMIDLDNLKPINDVHGHLAGDRVLMDLAELIQRAVRPYDVAGRYGGDEFLIVVPQLGAEHAREAAERLRERVAQHDFLLPWSGQRVHPTLSIGLATYPEDGLTRAELIAASDRAMYRAKADGKNRVRVAQELSR